MASWEKPLDCCPYAVKAAERLSRLSGYIEEGLPKRLQSHPARLAGAGAEAKNAPRCSAP
jgi:hypothetical protein